VADEKRVRRGDSAGVLFPPPLLFALPLAGGVWLNARAPWPLAVEHRDAALAIGIGAIVAGVAIALAAVLTFNRRGTTVLPALRPTTAIVATGPYRFTRNPMYVGMALGYLGISAGLNTVWPLLFLPVVLLMVDRLVIRREERYLAAKFGAEYYEYRRRVRRWL
jgi:protein-S-isoprenylcysteine O-methyltransferase Ste14